MPAERQASGVRSGVRWDAAVQDNGFWSDPSPPRPEAPEAGTSRRVQIWLFGSLTDGITERPLAVDCHGAFSIADIVAELGRRYGRAFLDRMTDPGGGILRNCRVFVNGHAHEDAATPIQTGALQTDIELILLTAAEGG